MFFHHQIVIHQWGWTLVLNPDGTTTAWNKDKTTGCSWRRGAGPVPESREHAAYQAASTALVIAHFGNSYIK